MLSAVSDALLCWQGARWHDCDIGNPKPACSAPRAETAEFYTFFWSTDETAVHFHRRTFGDRRNPISCGPKTHIYGAFPQESGSPFWSDTRTHLEKNEHIAGFCGLCTAGWSRRSKCVDVSRTNSTIALIARESSAWARVQSTRFPAAASS